MKKISVIDSHNGRSLVIERTGAEDRFEERMILSLDHPSLLKPLPDRFLCDGSFRYDISGMTSLRENCGKRSLSAPEITSLILRLDETVRYLEDHMLCDSNLLLEPEYIFLDSERLYFIPAASGGESFSESIQELGKFVFLQSDTENEEAVRLSGGILRAILGGECRMHDLLRVCGKNRQKEEVTKAVVIYPEGNTVTGEYSREEETKKLPVFDQERNPEPKEPKKENTGEERFLQFLEDREGKKQTVKNAKILRRTLILLAAEVLLCDAAFFLRGKAFLMKILPAALIILVVTALYGVLSVLTEKHNHVSVQKFEK